MKTEIETLKENRRKYYQNFVRARRAHGWRHIATLLPPEIYTEVLAHKNRLMDQWRLNNLKKELENNNKTNFKV